MYHLISLKDFGGRLWIYIVSCILYRFSFYKFAYLLKCVCKPQMDTHNACVVIYQHAQNGEKFELPDEREHAPSYPRRCSVFSLQLSHDTCVIFMVCSEPRFLHFCALRWWFHCLKRHLHTVLSAEVLLGVLRHREPGRYFMEKIFVLGKFCSDMSYSAVGWEFNVCNSHNVKLGVFKQRHT